MTPSKPAAGPTAASSEKRLDPLEVFQQVVDRYHRLLTYRDSVKLVQTMQRDGEEARSVETNLTCTIADGQLTVATSGGAIREALGLDLPVKPPAELSKVSLKYDLWLAPHMALRFADRPLNEWRAGVEEGFTPTEAESVTINDRPMVHVELKSGDGLSEHCQAKFDLFINPDSLLIERIEGQQRMADGSNCQTTLHITPVDHESEAELTQPTT